VTLETIASSHILATYVSSKNVANARICKVGAIVMSLRPDLGPEIMNGNRSNDM
jgi:hypothetical protein